MVYTQAHQFYYLNIVYILDTAELTNSISLLLLHSKAIFPFPYFKVLSDIFLYGSGTSC